MSWLFNLGGGAKQTDDWDFYFMHVDDQPASIFVDLGQKANAPIANLSVMCALRLTLLSPRPDGLSSDEEFETLNRIGATLEKKQVGTKALYVGRVTTTGRRDFVFYTADVKAFTKSVTAAMKAFPTYAYEVIDKEDADWSIYLDFLYPAPPLYQSIMNRRVVEALEGQGDDPTKVRRLDHRAYFITVEEAKAFEAEVAALGFSIKGSNCDTGIADVSVDFCRDDAPENIDDVTDKLLPLLSVHNGKYDGWGCESAD